MTQIEDIQRKQYEIEERVQQAVNYVDDKVRASIAHRGSLDPHQIASGASDTFKVSSQETFRSNNNHNHLPSQ